MESAENVNHQLISELSQLSKAIEGLKKEGQERKKREEALRYRTDGFAALYETALDITKPHDLPTLLHTITERAVSLLDGTSGSIFMCDSEQEEVQCMVSYKRPNDHSGFVGKYGEGISGIVAQTGEPLIIDDYETWPGKNALNEKVKTFTSLISVPMAWQDEVVGVIHVIHDEEAGRFSNADMELLTMFANQAVIAIENARLVERVQNDASELQYRLDEIEARTEEQRRANLALQQEIEQRKNIEGELKASEEKYRNILKSIEDGYYEVDIPGNFTFFNDSLCKMLGKSPYELNGMNFKDFTDDENHRIGYNAFNSVYRSGIPLKEIAWEIIRHDGKKRIVEASVTLMKDKESVDKRAGFRGIIRDITERKEAEEALMKSEERFRFLVEKSPLAISLIDRDNQYKYINPKFNEIFGYTLTDIPTGMEWLNNAFPDPEYREGVISDWINDIKDYGVGEARPCTYNVCCKDGSMKMIHFRSVVMEAGEQIIFYEDITEHKTLEAQLLRAQKVESLGTLAGGMAHNFNNLLMGIQGYSSLMLMNMETDHPHYERLKKIEKLVNSGSKLTHQLLGYARKGQYEIKPLSLNHLTKETSETFCMTRKEMRVHRDFGSHGCGILADQGQIEQVLLNLYVNAADALPEGGDLFIKTENVTSEDMKGKSYNPEPGNYVKLTVRDTGAGMDAKTMECIFDPFFTTKGLGKGTGLGLASVYGIIKAHGGYIDVESEPDNGTTFTIYIPRSEKNFENKSKNPAKIVEGCETILFADDEALILDAGTHLLESLGYNVLQVEGGIDAVNEYEKNQNNIDLVVLDMVMPDMNGGEVYDRLKKFDPGIKVLLCSGYSINGQAAEILKRGCNGFIQKPFTLEKLSQSIREVIED